MTGPSRAATVIVSRPRAPYLEAMRQALAKLLLIFAILFMPFGMAAPAAAETHHAPAASSAMNHCPDKGAANDRMSGECTMGCAAALPALGRPTATLLAPIAAPSVRLRAEPLTDLQPETATPPPRIA